MATIAGTPVPFGSKYGFDAGGVYTLSGNGLPGASGGQADTAPLGSLYTDRDTSRLYRKKAAGTGTDKWVYIPDQDDVDTARISMPWQDPADLLDDTPYADLAAAETAVNSGTIDGEAVADGTRILFTAISGDGGTVRVVQGTVGVDATLVEDENAADVGDAILIKSGTSEGMEMVYRADGWQPTNLRNRTEVVNHRGYTGKPAGGAILPQYTSVTQIASNDDLTAAIGKLDAVSGADPASGVHFDPTDPLNTKLAKHDGLLALIAQVFEENDVTTTRTIDSLTADSVGNVVYHVIVTQTADPSIMWSGRISAVHDGHAGADASKVLTSVSDVNKTGPMPGLDVDIDLDGTGAAQVLRLRVSSNNAVHVKAVRTMVTPHSAL